MTPSEQERIARLEQWKDTTDGWLKNIAVKIDRVEEKLDSRLPAKTVLAWGILSGAFTSALTVIGFLIKGD